MPKNPRQKHKIDPNVQPIISQLFENITLTNIPTDRFYKAFLRHFIQNELKKRQALDSLFDVGVMRQVYHLIRQNYGIVFKYELATYKRFSKLSVFGLKFSPKVHKDYERFAETHRKCLSDRQKRRVMRKKLEAGTHIDNQQQTIQYQEKSIRQDKEEQSQYIQQSQKGNLFRNETYQQVLFEAEQSIHQAIKNKNKRAQKKEGKRRQPDVTNQPARQVNIISTMAQKLIKSMKSSNKKQTQQQQQKPDGGNTNLEHKNEKGEDYPKLYQFVEILRHQNEELRGQIAQLKTVINYFMKISCQAVFIAENVLRLSKISEQAEQVAKYPKKISNLLPVSC